jgi:hypothetical protein
MRTELVELADLRKAAEISMLLKRADTPSWERSWRARNRWDRRWEEQVVKVIARGDRSADTRRLARAGRKAWGVGFLKKQRRPHNIPPPDEVAAQLRAETDEAAFSKGAMAMYLTLGADEGEEAGQYTLDSLGLNQTFAWAGPRDFPGNLLAVRGSKLLTAYYDNHRDRLAKMVIEKCDPSKPKTMGQLTKEIRQEWDKLTAKEAKRIARTESAFVWETTNWNAMTLNGVQEVEWLIGRGPSIGPPKSYPVCEHCLEQAALSPHVMDDMQEIPPLHPHCRCTLIPKHDPEWLPPAEPWAGAATKMSVFT